MDEGRDLPHIVDIVSAESRPIARPSRVDEDLLPSTETASHRARGRFRRLSRDDPARARALRSRAGFGALARYAYLMDAGDPWQLSRMFSGLTAVVATVPVFTLRVPDDRQTFGEIAEAVLSLTRRDS